MPSFKKIFGIWLSLISITSNQYGLSSRVCKVKSREKKKIFYSDSLQDIPTDMCLEVPRKKYVNMGKKAV